MVVMGCGLVTFKAQALHHDPTFVVLNTNLNGHIRVCTVGGTVRLWSSQ